MLCHVRMQIQLHLLSVTYFAGRGLIYSRSVKTEYQQHPLKFLAISDTVFAIERGISLFLALGNKWDEGRMAVHLRVGLESLNYLGKRVTIREGLPLTMGNHQTLCFHSVSKPSFCSSGLDHPFSTNLRHLLYLGKVGRFLFFGELGPSSEHGRRILPHKDITMMCAHDDIQ